MKSAGLNSTYRTMLKRTTKIIAATAHQDNHLARLEKQKTLRLQAAKAQFERQKKISQDLPETKTPSFA
jgi:hypothetical protein